VEKISPGIFRGHQWVESWEKLAHTQRWHITVLAGEKVEPKPMNPKFVIRSETAADAGAITEVTAAAFNTLEISNHAEQFIVEALRTAGALTVSLVAAAVGRVIGRIAFSPVTISDGPEKWYGLGPVSVLPEYQRQGIGKALIEEGLSRLKALNARGCCLMGHPDYYRKFGFINPPGLAVEGVPPEVFFALSLDGQAPLGTVTFHEAFKADGRPTGTGDAPPPA
jgi:putative acetyltransferase